MSQLPLPEPDSDELRAVVRSNEQRLIYGYLHENRVTPPTAVEISAYVASSLGGAHAHTDRRRRDLGAHFEIEKVLPGPRYLLVGWKEDGGATERARISGRVRALVLSAGRCAMCGKTPTDDHIRLVVDHRVPKNWGGTDDLSNLQALCEECNGGKKDLFESYDAEGSAVADAARHDEPHRRIGELLRAFEGEWVPSMLIEAVASRGARQEDWQKRTRELRVIGWTIESERRRATGTAYRANPSSVCPSGNIAKAIRAEEKRRRESP